MMTSSDEMSLNQQQEPVNPLANIVPQTVQLPLQTTMSSPVVDHEYAEEEEKESLEEQSYQNYEHVVT